MSHKGNLYIRLATQIIIPELLITYVQSEHFDKTTLYLLRMVLSKKSGIMVRKNAKEHLSCFVLFLTEETHFCITAGIHTNLNQCNQGS